MLISILEEMCFILLKPLILKLNALIPTFKTSNGKYLLLTHLLKVTHTY